MKNLLIIVICLFFIQCEPVTPQQSAVNKKMIFDNFDYEDIVGMVRINPLRNGRLNELENPIISLNGADRLVLEFDLLTDQFENLSAKIYHCNKDWTGSVLRDMEFLDQINNYRITAFDYSVNTVQPYINYRFDIPRPIISGNYILSVFRRSNPKDVLFNRKFMITNGIVAIDQTVRVSTTIDLREENQQIEYTINYGDLIVNAPTEDISTVILQNHNWNTAITDIPPTLIRTNEGFMEFQHFDLQTNFPGWNEFRFADLRTLNMAGRNVSKISNTGDAIIAPLLLDPSRETTPYSLNIRDINGNFVIQNNDPGEIPLNADYAKVIFSLNSEPINGDVFVVGQFNNWQMTDANKMRYIENGGKGRYQANLLMKQGYYEYHYFVKSPSLPDYYFEGSHFPTENEYEILVYYRRPGNVNDELVGYKKFKSIELN